MKFQIDTNQKIIRIEGIVNFGELVKELDKLFPKKEWKKYSLKTNTVIYNWGYPIIIHDYPQPCYPNYPWYGTITVGDSTGVLTTDTDNSGPTLTATTAGVYSVETVS